MSVKSEIECERDRRRKNPVRIRESTGKASVRDRENTGNTSVLLSRKGFYLSKEIRLGELRKDFEVDLLEASSRRERMRGKSKW